MWTLRRLPVTCASILLLVAACANVPKEVVELSYRLGQDLGSLHDSYKTLVHQHFDSLRAQRIEYLENVWTPAFVAAWIEDGHLVAVATGKEVYSEEKSSFVLPTPGQEKPELLASVQMWSESALRQIDKKKGELLSPLDKDEKELVAAVAEAFARVIRGNAIITAHLNSLRNVQEVQDELLSALDLKDLRTTINTRLATASDKAQKALEEVKKADAIVAKRGARLKGRNQ